MLGFELFALAAATTLPLLHTSAPPLKMATQNRFMNKAFALLSLTPESHARLQVGCAAAL